MPNAFNQTDVLTLIRSRTQKERTTLATEPLATSDLKKRRFLPKRDKKKVLKWLIRNATI